MISTPLKFFLVCFLVFPIISSFESTDSNLQEIYDRVTAWTKVPKEANFLGDGCFTRWMDFRNYQTNPGFDLQTTNNNQNAGGDGWWMHSQGNQGSGWSRLRFADYTFNSFPGAKTHIAVIMRGAPDGGKNSNAYLIQTNNQYDLKAAVQDGTKDEIDFSEYYGNYKATYCLYKSGRTVSGFPGTYPVGDAGTTFYKYEIVLDNGARNLHFFLSIDGQPLLHHVEVNGDDVPNQPLELFAGIWDCSGNSWCPGKFDGVSGMVIQSIWVQGC